MCQPCSDRGDRKSSVLLKMTIKIRVSGLGTRTSTSSKFRTKFSSRSLKLIFIRFSSRYMRR